MPALVNHYAGTLAIGVIAFKPRGPAAQERKRFLSALSKTTLKRRLSVWEN